MTQCYFCGGVADGPDDHVPPEVLFRGLVRSYKSPNIVTVPACSNHNEGCSGDDELLAWVMSHGSVSSDAAFDVGRSLMEPVEHRIWSDRAFADSRLDSVGIRVLRDPIDYDDAGRAKAPWIDPSYVEHTEKKLRSNWARLKRELQKISAGLFFYSSHGKSLGAERISQIEIVSPDFKQIEPEILLTRISTTESEHFEKVFARNNTPHWTRVTSGAAEVFECDIARHHNAWRFAMRMRFYQSIRVWASLGDEG